MSLYGLAIYGRSKYGPEVSRYVDYAVDPFVADPVGYDAIRLTWASPKGDWTKFRLVKNWQGFPTTQNDGQTLLEVDYASTSFVDNVVSPGEWHYYAVWVCDSTGLWQEAATACTLMVREHGYADLLFDAVPAHHRLVQGASDDLTPIENADLRKFLTVLARGMDYAKTYYESMLFLNDPMRNRLSQLVLLGHQFGVEWSPIADPRQFRKRVLNAGPLARMKGTLEGLRSVVSMTTGWDVDLYPGPNLMLSEDHASFVHPYYDDWNAGINYPAGTKVNYNGFLYSTAAGGAYGTAQAPSGAASSNTWWTLISNLVDTTLKATDGTFSGWAPVNFSGGAVPTNQVAVGVGVQSATDSTVKWANTLLVQNTGATTADLGARSAGGDLTDPAKAVAWGTPIPRGTVWDSTVAYRTGDVVRYAGLAYTALSESTGVTPGTSAADWDRLTYGYRRRVSASMHVKGDDAAAQLLLAYPVLNLFDEHGKHLGTLDGSLHPTTNTFDSFRYAAGAPAFPDAGSGSWTVTGTATRDITTGLFVNVGSRATIAGTADGQAAVTFVRQTTGATQTLLFRSTDASNEFRATRTGLYRVQAGASTLIANFSRAFADAERILVSFSASNITVYNGGDVVLSATDGFNATATTHGILVS